MTELLTCSGAWLLQQAAAFSDTVVMKTVAERDWFETVTGIATSVMTVTLLGLAIVLAPAAFSFWRTFRKVRALLDRVYADVAPITRHAHNVADNLDYITTSIRNDVAQVNATIATANRRLQQAVRETETRMNEFNALLKVVQQEAEQAFVSTAAAVHGVRTGAAAFGELAEVDADDEDEDEDDLDDAYLEREGVTDGSNDESDQDEAGDDRDEHDRAVAHGSAARPRVRPRRRRQ